MPSFGSRREATILIFFALLVTFTRQPARGQGSNESTQAKKRIVILGDSLAAGLGVEPEQAFPALLQKKIDDLHWNFEVVNAGVSGDTSAGGLRRIDWLLKRKMSVLIVELGGNDGLRGIMPEETKSNLLGIIKKTRAKYPETLVLVAGMQMPQNMGQEYTEEFKDTFSEVARETDSLLIPFLLEGVGAKPEFNQPDQIHPNVKGHRILAENVWKVLKPALEKLHP